MALIKRPKYDGAAIREAGNAPPPTLPFMNGPDLLGTPTGGDTYTDPRPPMPAPKPGFFQSGGLGQNLLQSAGDALASYGGLTTNHMFQQRQDIEDKLYERRSAREWQQFMMKNAYELAHPKPDEYERTLVAAGYQPGTPEWIAQMKKRAQNMTDPAHMINDPEKGVMLVGGAYGYPGQTNTPESAGYDELPPGYTVRGGAGPQTPRGFP